MSGNEQGCPGCVAWTKPTEADLRHAEQMAPLIEAQPLDERKDGARKVAASELPSRHQLWKSWALHLADDVLALTDRLSVVERERDEYRTALLRIVNTRSPGVIAAGALAATPLLSVCASCGYTDGHSDVCRSHLTSEET